VRQHFSLDVNRVTYVPTRTATTACVDSRHEYPVIGTPGGDIAEFIGGFAVYLNLTGQTLTQVHAVLRRLLEFVSWPGLPGSH
jgi:hypothetical protein